MKIVFFAIAAVITLFVLLVITYNYKCQMDNVEKFNSETSMAEKDLENRNLDYISSGIDGYSAADPQGNEVYKSLEETTGDFKTQTAGSTCISKDRLTSSDLLPSEANSKWAELNPQCSGDVQDQNYLTAGYHVGINTVGQSLRNANLQLRHEPPNPQIPIYPWQISTIGPDSRVSGLLDIGSPPVY